MVLRDVRMRLMGATQQNGYEKQAVVSAAIGVVALACGPWALADGAWLIGAGDFVAGWYMLGFARFLWNDIDKGRSRRDVDPWPGPEHGVTIRPVESDPQARAVARTRVESNPQARAVVLTRVESNPQARVVADELLAKFAQTLKEK